MNSALNKLPAKAMATIELTQALVQFDTTNPPGNEFRAAHVIASRLEGLGIAVERYALSPGRDSLIARLNASSLSPAICFCGHLDTVPLGTQEWTKDPLGGEISEYRIWGRGTTDMKGGVAAMVTAFERLHLESSSAHVCLVLCSSEETGCQGAVQIADKLGSVGAMIVAEPTSGLLAIAHKGVLWLKLSAKGKAAHGSMPHLGVNAIEMMADAIVALRKLDFDIEAHPLLGLPTHNIGTAQGGAAANIVADSCECMLDVRLIPGVTPDDARTAVETLLGPTISVNTVLALNAVSTDPDDPWLRSVSQRSREMGGPEKPPISVSYFTDASILAPALKSPPVAIIGPGDPALAHQVDESCSVSAIWHSSQLYERLAQDWASSHPNKEKGNS